MNTPQQQLDQLRERAESLLIQAEINTLEKQIQAAETGSRLVEGEWGELVNRRDYLYDTPGFSQGVDFRISSPSDRHKGKNYPFFETETDLANIRGIARHIAGTYEIAVCAMENLTSYAMGTGFDYQFKEHKNIEAPEGLVQIVEQTFKEWQELNKWCGNKEIEAFQNTHRDGEAFLWLKETPAGPKVRIVDPCFITEPANPRAVEDYIGEIGLCWSFGVASPDEIYTDETVGYFYQPYVVGDSWEFIAASDMTHVKLNVDSVVKRGMSDFYAVYQDLERAAKVFENTAQGTAIQAAIAYIKEHAAGTSGDAITLARNARANSSTTIATSLGNRTSYTEKFRAGKILETVGTKYHAGPLGDNNAEAYIAVGQAMLRMVGARWQMPEYMISGDASNANYSSTLVSGGPFDKATQRRQARFVSAYSEIVWKALDSYARRGRFKEFGISSAQELKQLLCLNIVPEPPSVQDKKEQFEIDKGLVDLGVMSKQTLAGRYSLDYDSEKDSIEDEMPEQPESLPLANSQQTTNASQLIPPLDSEDDIPDDTQMEEAARLLWGDYCGGKPSA